MLFLPELTLLLGALAIFLVSLGAPTVDTIRKLTIAGINDKRLSMIVLLYDFFYQVEPLAQSDQLIWHSL